MVRRVIQSKLSRLDGLGGPHVERPNAAVASELHRRAPTVAACAVEYSA